MVNKLRIVSLGGGTTVVIIATWGAVEYPAPIKPFVLAATIGVFVAAVPSGLAYGKLFWRRTSQVRAVQHSGRDRGRIFLSDTAVESRAATLSAVDDALEAVTEFEPRTSLFPEGRGRTVVHTNFHNSFVRITDDDRLSVTGESEPTEQIADLVESAVDVSFSRVKSNPFLRPEGVKGAPRVFLAILLMAVVLAGVMTVAGAAYPSGAYNPAEKTVLVGIDLRGDLDPWTSATETRLTKAAFLVRSFEEKSVEVRWQANGSGSKQVATHATEALAIDTDARSQLAAVRSSSPSPPKIERANRIERRLRRAERDVADQIAAAAETAPADEVPTLRRVSRRLTARS